jgi:hypothetical protein
VLADHCRENFARFEAAIREVDEVLERNIGIAKYFTRFGKGTIHSGGTGNPGTNRVWTMKQERRTPAYTTCLADVPVARA